MQALVKLLVHKRIIRHKVGLGLKLQEAQFAPVQTVIVDCQATKTLFLKMHRTYFIGYISTFQTDSGNLNQTMLIL